MEEFKPDPEYEVDPYLPIEVIIIEGLNAAVEKSWITLQDKLDWLDAYNATRNAPIIPSRTSILQSPSPPTKL